MSAAALATALTSAPAGAVRSNDASPYTQYVRAYAAETAGMTELAASHYGMVLAANPGDTLLATRAYRQAVVAGDKPLAIRAARLLDRSGALPPDGLLMLLVDAVNNSDWKGARAAVARIEKEQAFSFLAPIMRGWISFGARDQDPWAAFGRTTPGNGVAAVYAAENRALMLLAQGSVSEASDAIKALTTGTGVRELHLRALAAQALAASGKRDAALSLLQGEEPAIEAAARRIRTAKRVAPPVVDAGFGLSELLVRVAVDINRERVTPLSPILARLATFASPTNPEAWLAAAQLLAATDRNDAALSALAKMPPDSALALAGRVTRIRILVGKGANVEALSALQGIVAAPNASVGDWTLLGDTYNSLERPADAADAYRHAIALVEATGKPDERLGTLWLLLGSALEQSGKWPEAKAALENAAKLAPDQAVVLNYLGYAQLERHENIAEARSLIEKANQLKPGDAAITDSLGWAFYLQGDVAGAIEKLETAAEGDPGGSEINEHLGDAYWTAGRRIEARYAWAAALVTADKKNSARLQRKMDLGLDPVAANP